MTVVVLRSEFLFLATPMGVIISSSEVGISNMIF